MRLGGAHSSPASPAKADKPVTKKRGRLSKQKPEQSAWIGKAKEAQEAEQQSAKRGRGRPPGSKNTTIGGTVHVGSQTTKKQRGRPLGSKNKKSRAKGKPASNDTESGMESEVESDEVDSHCFVCKSMADPGRMLLCDDCDRSALQPRLSQTRVCILRPFAQSLEVRSLSLTSPR
jgi:hypothetical protein